MKRILLFIIPIFFLVGNAFGEPSNIIRKAMNTPASIFDLFLSSLYVSQRCPGDPERRLDACLTVMSYEFHSDQIKLSYKVKPGSGTFESLRKAKSAEKRKSLLVGHLKHISEQIGPGSLPSLSIIWDIPIRPGYQDKDFDGFNKIEFKEEIIKRIVIMLSVRVEGEFYHATRYANGEITVY